MAKRIAEKKTNLNGAAGMETTAAHLQRSIEALDEAAWYFDCLGMHTQSGQLNGAASEIEDVQNLLGVFLGTLDQDWTVHRKDCQHG